MSAVAESCPISTQKNGVCTRCRIRAYGRRYRAENRDERKRYCAENRDRLNARRRDYWAENRDKINARARQHYAANRDMFDVRRRKYVAKNHDKVNTHIWRRQGILNRRGEPFTTDYVELFERQGGRCLLCVKPAREGKRLVPDHCHATGIARALLCGACNTIEGLMATRGIDPHAYAARLAILRLIPSLAA